MRWPICEACSEGKRDNGKHSGAKTNPNLTNLRDAHPTGSGTKVALATSFDLKGAASYCWGLPPTSAIGALADSFME